MMYLSELNNVLNGIIKNDALFNTIKTNSKEIELTIDSNIDGEKLFLETFKISNNFRFGTRGKNLIITLKLQGLEKHFIYYLIDLLFVIEKAIIK